MVKEEWTIKNKNGRKRGNKRENQTWNLIHKRELKEQQKTITCKKYQNIECNRESIVI